MVKGKKVADGVEFYVAAASSEVQAESEKRGDWQTLLESGAIQQQGGQLVLTTKASEIQLPDTIQGIIAARLDRLDNRLKYTMQLASVIGREFSFRILEAVSDMPEPAWAALADSYAMICMYWDASEANLTAAERASKKALELLPGLAESHVSRGLSHFVRGDSTAAIAEFETALNLDPELFDAWYFYGRVCFQQGELQHATELFERAERIDPEDFQAPILLRQIYRTLGRDEEALAAARRGTERAERRLELNPDDTRALNLALGGLVELAEKEKVIEFAERSLAIDGDNPDTLYNVACGFARIGEPEPSLECLERASMRGMAIAKWAENDSDLD